MDEKRLKWVISGLDFDRLNDWETQFVEDVEKRFEDRKRRDGHGYVTDKEEDILERLYKEKGK